MRRPSGWEWGSRQHATALRAVLLAIWLAIVAITPYGSYAKFPLEMSAGYGLGRVLLGGHVLKAFFFSQPVLLGLKWSAMAACVLAILFPNRARWLTPVVLGLVVVLDSLTRSLNGYINHAQLVPLFVLLVFAVFGGRRYLPTLGFGADTEASADGGGTQPRYAAVVWLAALLIVIPYTFIAMNRLIVGGFQVFRGDALLDYINQASRRYSVYGSSVFLGLIRVSWLAGGLKVGYFITTLFELTSAAALFSRVYRLIWLPVIVSFHFVTLFAMNIFFWENLLLLLVIFGWGIWRRNGPSRLGPDGSPA